MHSMPPLAFSAIRIKPGISGNGLMVTTLFDVSNVCIPTRLPSPPAFLPPASSRVTFSDYMTLRPSRSMCPFHREPTHNTSSTVLPLRPTLEVLPGASPCRGLGAGPDACGGTFLLFPPSRSGRSRGLVKSTTPLDGRGRAPGFPSIPRPAGPPPMPATLAFCWTAA